MALDGIVKMHGVVWIAETYAKMGGHIPSSIRKEEMPEFNFWLRTYMGSSIEQMVLSMYRADSELTAHIPQEMKGQFEKEMERRAWFEENLPRFMEELDSAVDHITQTLQDRKYMKRVFKELPEYCYSTLLSFMEDEDREEVGVMQKEETFYVTRFQGSFFRNQLSAFRKLEEEGYIQLESAKFDAEDEQRIYDHFVEMQKEPDPQETKDAKNDEEDDFQTFPFFYHCLVYFPEELTAQLKGLFTEREKKILGEKTLVAGLMYGVDAFYKILPIETIHELYDLTWKKSLIPSVGALTDEELISYIKKCDGFRVVELMGKLYGTRKETYEEYKSCTRRKNLSTLEDYKDCDEYDNIWNYLYGTQVDGDSPAIWPDVIYMRMMLMGYLGMTGPYERLYALLAQIVMENHSMDSTFANMFNNMPWNHDEDEDDLFHKETDGVDDYLQNAFEALQELGACLAQTSSMAECMDALGHRIGISGLKTSVQRDLMEKIKRCRMITPSFYLLGAPDHEEMWDDYEVEEDDEDEDEDYEEDYEDEDEDEDEVEDEDEE